MIDTSLLCLDTDQASSIFDFSIAPSFLLYSYIPFIILCLIIALLVYFQNRSSSINKYFSAFTLTYAIFLIVEIIHWVATPVTLVHFSWQVSILLHFLIIYFLLSFYYRITFGKNISYKSKSLIVLSGVPIFFLLSTELNINGFDLYNCEGINGIMWNYIYIIQIIAILIILRLAILKNRISKDKIKDFIFSTATILFILVFFSTNIWGDATLLYEVNIIGPAGMLAFIIFVTISIVKYQTFNFKLLGSQALVFALFFLNFATLFIRKIENMRLILFLNLVMIAVIGYFLIRSVKKVDTQRELLEQANQNQQSLLHFITHQVKGYMTKSRNIFDSIIAGDYGETNEKIKEIAKYGFDSETRGVETVQSILNASNLKTGKTQIQKTKNNISALIAELIDHHKDDATKKGLELTFDIEPNIEAEVDVVQIKEVFKNLLHNSIIYTQKGTVHVELKKKDDKVLYRVVDTGFGLTSEDKAKLFKEGGKSTDSLSVNVDSTGYGLYIAKQIVERHNGTIGAESKGRNQGSVFFVKLPLAR